MQETPVWFLGWEDPLEKGQATLSLFSLSILYAHRKRPWCREGLGAGGEGDGRGGDGWMASLTRWTWVWVNSGSLVMDREAWRAVIHGVAKSRIRLSEWTDWLILYTIIKCHRLSGLQTIEIYFSQFWRPTSPRSRCWQIGCLVDTPISGSHKSVSAETLHVRRGSGSQGSLL